MLAAVLDTNILARGLRAGPETAVGFIFYHGVYIVDPGAFAGALRALSQA
ncbi:MAG: hypothetical protein M3Z66_17565 [Chloroflexota bacterium]|nr:hypothetical protein [Chloroflexota bacterium]